MKTIIPINKEIVEKVKQEEAGETKFLAEQLYLARCLQSRICPQCGKFLNFKSRNTVVLGNHVNVWKCSCGFKNKIVSSDFLPFKELAND